MTRCRVKKMAKAGEQCVFCGWTRRSSWPFIRFFNIPREPGLKKIRWLQAFAERKISHKDRVCSIHFRSGRPSNDPSHEDFAPHLYLDSVPDPDDMLYMNMAADRDSDCNKILAAEASLQEAFHKRIDKIDVEDYKLPLLPTRKNVKPAIMQRHRRTIKEELVEENEDYEAQPPVVTKAEVFEYSEPSSSSTSSQCSVQVKQEGPQTVRIGNRRRTAIPLDRLFIDATGIQAGQTVSIKCRRSYPVVKKESVASISPVHIEQRPPVETPTLSTQQSHFEPYDQRSPYQYPQHYLQCDQSSSGNHTPMPTSHETADSGNAKEGPDNLDDMPPLVERMEPNPEQIALEQQHQLQLIMEEENERLAALENDQTAREPELFRQMPFWNYLPSNDSLPGSDYNDPNVDIVRMNDHGMENALLQHQDYQFALQHDLLSNEDDNVYYNEAYDDEYGYFQLPDHTGAFDGEYEGFQLADHAADVPANLQS